jgi:hypothetical protein
MVAKFYLIPFSQVEPLNPDGHTQPSRSSSNMPPFMQVTSKGTEKVKKKIIHLCMHSSYLYYTRSEQVYQVLAPRETLLMLSMLTSIHLK